MVPKLTGVLLLPPMAIARLGDSKIPLDAFDWAEDPNAHGGGQTVIRPALTFDVQPDGSIRPRVPPIIQFRDTSGGPIRPTAPFFEVWARFDDGTEPRPLTATTLAALGGSSFSVVLADPRTGKELATLDTPASPHGPASISFSSDSTRLVVTGGGNAAVWVWDLPMLRRELHEMKLDWP